MINHAGRRSANDTKRHTLKVVKVEENNGDWHLHDPDGIVSLYCLYGAVVVDKLQRST